MPARMERSLTVAAVLPVFDVRERHAVRVKAPADLALAAARRVTPSDAPLLHLLFRLRGLPVSERAVWDAMLGIGFRELAPGVGVGIGRPWRVRGGMREPRALTEFTEFTEPGWAKMAMDFSADGNTLVTETRVQCTDASSRRRFRAYWLVVRPFSGLVRRSWLRAAKRRAEASK
jgi:hypothetical protein